MRSSKFKYLNRAHRRVLVLIPGWGFDHRIFERMALDYDYLFPLEPRPSTFNNDLKKELDKKKLTKVSLFGWSLGAFLACDFMYEYPHLVKEVYLISARRQYTKDAIRDMKHSLKKDRKASLYKFYMECFFPDRKGFLWFREKLLEHYLREIDIGYLLEGLDYLSDASLTDELLDNQYVKFLHGREDKVAPLKEWELPESVLNRSRFTILERTGHVPFLAAGFKKAINGFTDILHR